MLQYQQVYTVYRHCNAIWLGRIGQNKTIFKFMKCVSNTNCRVPFILFRMPSEHGISDHYNFLNKFDQQSKAPCASQSPESGFLAYIFGYEKYSYG